MHQKKHISELNFLNIRNIYFWNIFYQSKLHKTFKNYTNLVFYYNNTWIRACPWVLFLDKIFILIVALFSTQLPINLKIYHLYLKLKLWRLDWRDGLAVKITYCSRGGPEFSSQPPQQVVYNCLKLQGPQCPLLASTGSPHTCAYMQILINESKSFKNIQWTEFCLF